MQNKFSNPTPNRLPVASTSGTPAAWLSSGLLLLCVLATNPRLEMGLHDDWSYIYSAMVLAKTGHIVYNGWATAMLGWLLYGGALFARCFGPSFTAIRAFGLVIALLTVPLIHRLLVRLGVSVQNATFGTLTFVLSPLFIPLAASFMSDIPSLFCLLLCMYCCVRAMQSHEDRSAVAWLVFAAASNVLGGSVRQIAWLGVLVMVPSTGWFLRRRRGMLPAMALVLPLCFVTVALMLHWFNHQPYVAVEKLVAMPVGVKGVTSLSKEVIKSCFTVALLLLPILTGFVCRYPVRDRSAISKLVLISSAIAVTVTSLSWRHGGIRWLTLLIGDYVSAKGILDYPWIPGLLSDVIPRPVGALVAFAVFISLAAFLLIPSRAGECPPVWQKASRSPLFWLMGPFCCVYGVLILTRAAIFDRYLLPLIFVAVVLLLRFYERQVGGRLPWICALPLTALALYGVAGTHDLYSMSRARLVAANEVLATGAPRTSLVAGFEFDGWTQVEMTGYVNEPRIHTPAGAYQPPPLEPGAQKDCVLPFKAYTPSLRPRFFLSNEPDLCYRESSLSPVSYSLWLPRREHTIYIGELR